MSEQTNQTFTSRKLDWLRCVCFDRRLKPYDFKVAFIIAQHVNQKSQTAHPSDATIADETGGSVRNVKRARVRLNDAGWISWRRTQTSNVYALVFTKVSGFMDAITASRDARNETRQKRREMGHRWPISANKKGHRGPNKIGHPRPN
jgi:hypothetical protein